MSHSRQLPVVAALVGAAALASGASSAAAPTTEQAELGASYCELPDRLKPASNADASSRAGTPEPLPTLADLLEQRARHATEQRRVDDIERIGELWLTLHHRGQLERSVERGDGYLTVALRHQGVSAHRADARAARFRAMPPSEFEAGAEPAGAGGQAFHAWERPDQLFDLQQWLERLEEPYRTAVALSLQGCSRREVAAEMGVADATVRKWMQRLRERHGEELGV